MPLRSHSRPGYLAEHSAAVATSSRRSDHRHGQVIQVGDPEGAAMARNHRRSDSDRARLARSRGRPGLAELGSWQAPLTCWGGRPLWRVAIILAAVAFASLGWVPGVVAIAADHITGN
jgi:hypothetical protein